MELVLDVAGWVAWAFTLFLVLGGLPRLFRETECSLRVNPREWWFTVLVTAASAAGVVLTWSRFSRLHLWWFWLASGMLATWISGRARAEAADTGRSHGKAAFPPFMRSMAIEPSLFAAVQADRGKDVSPLFWAVQGMQRGVPVESIAGYVAKFGFVPADILAAKMIFDASVLHAATGLDIEPGTPEYGGFIYSNWAPRVREALASVHDAA